MTSRATQTTAIRRPRSAPAGRSGPVPAGRAFPVGVLLRGAVPCSFRRAAVAVLLYSMPSTLSGAQLQPRAELGLIPWLTHRRTRSPRFSTPKAGSCWRRWAPTARTRPSALNASLRKAGHSPELVSAVAHPVAAADQGRGQVRRVRPADDLHPGRPGAGHPAHRGGPARPALRGGRRRGMWRIWAAASAPTPWPWLPWTSRSRPWKWTKPPRPAPR